MHAVRTAFEKDDNEAVLLVDASNAFKTLNRQVALQSIRRISSPLATILINSYRGPADLYINGEVFLSQEGTTQGDPLAMPMYALATIRHIKRLMETPSKSGTQMTHLQWARSVTLESGGTSSPPLAQTLAIMPTQQRHGWLQERSFFQCHYIIC